MKLKLLFLFVVCVNIYSFSQNEVYYTSEEKQKGFGFNKYEEGIIEFKDGIKFRGLIKIVDFKKVRFKKKTGGKVYVYKANQFVRVKKNSQMAYLSKNTNKGFTLVRISSQGELDLFYQERRAYRLSPNGQSTLSNGFYKQYYIKKKGSEVLTQIPADYKTKKFRKVLKKLTADCKNFEILLSSSDEIEGNFKEYNDKTVVENIVDYYNEKCRSSK